MRAQTGPVASILRILLPGLSLLIWAAASPSSADEAPHPHFPKADDVRLSRQGEIYRIEIDMVTPAPLATAWEVLTDFDQMTRFVPNLERSQVTERQGNRLRLEQEGRAWFGPFSLTFGATREVDLVPMHEIRTRQITGTARSATSIMHLIPAGGGTRLEYRSEMVPDGGFLVSLIGPTAIRHEVAEQFSAVLREILRRAELKERSGSPARPPG